MLEEGRRAGSKGNSRSLRRGGFSAELGGGVSSLGVFWLLPRGSRGRVGATKGNTRREVAEESCRVGKDWSRKRADAGLAILPSIKTEEEEEHRGAQNRRESHPQTRSPGPSMMASILSHLIVFIKGYLSLGLYKIQPLEFVGCLLENVTPGAIGQERWSKQGRREKQYKDVRLGQPLLRATGAPLFQEPLKSR